MLVNGLDNCTQQSTKGPGDRLEFFIIRVVQQLLIHIPNEVDETFLLGAVDRVVGGVEVGNKNPVKVSEQFLQEVPLSCWSIHKNNFFQSRKNPYITLPGLELHFRLIDVKEMP